MNLRLLNHLHVKKPNMILLGAWQKKRIKREERLLKKKTDTVITFGKIFLIKLIWQIRMEESGHLIEIIWQENTDLKDFELLINFNFSILKNMEQYFGARPKICGYSFLNFF